jgi:hypothetical protein
VAGFNVIVGRFPTNCMGMTVSGTLLNFQSTQALNKDSYSSARGSGTYLNYQNTSKNCRNDEIIRNMALIYINVLSDKNAKR